MTSTVLVIGGAGFVGSHVCKAFAKAGIRPVTFDVRAAYVSLNRGWQIRRRRPQGETWGKA